MESVKKETISGVKWSAIERFSVQGIQFILGLIMARLLLPSDYGAVGMIAIFIAVSQSFVDSGFGNALVRKLDRTDVDFSTVFYFNVIVAIACYAILFIAAPWVASFFNIEVLCPVLRVQSVSLLLNSLIVIQNAKLSIALDFKGIAKRSTLSALLSGVIGVILAYVGWGVWALVAQTVLGSLINVLFLWIYVKWRPKMVFSWTSFKELGSYGSKLLASGLLHTIYTNLTTFVIGKFCSAKDLGFYNRGTQFATVPVNTVGGILGKVVYPIMVRLQNDDERLKSVYRKYICVMSIPIFLGCMMLFAIAKPLILVLLTERWAEAIIYLQIFIFAIMFDHICSINLTLLQVKGRSDLFLKLEVIKKTISIGILFASIPFGVIGICISKIIYTQIAVVINTYYTGKFFGLGYLAQIRDFSKYFIAACLACIPGFLLSTFTQINGILLIVLGCVLTFVLYCAFLWKDVYFKEITQIVLAKLRKSK